jgi:hypothetical protein
MTVQAQAEVPSQAPPVPWLVQAVPAQHWELLVQAWPADEHPPGWQVSCPEEPGMHWKPAQQSAPEVQAPPWGWQTWGASHWPEVLQMPEQQSAGWVQVAAFGWHVGPVPASAVPASVPPPVVGGRWQAYPGFSSSPVGRHSLGAQQEVSPGPLQVLPSWVHVTPWHV